jgi:adenylate cyclase
MGSDLRFNYSVLGDSVNLASRLEGQSKTYGVPVILGARTAKAAHDKFAMLELDMITVKGKTQPETIYTVLGRAELIDDENFRKARRVFEDMIARSRARDFDGASKALGTCRQLGESFGLLGLCELYASRCSKFLQTPPPADWNGVFAFETK